MFTLFQINAQMGINKDGSAPHQSAMMDIKASSTTNAKGLLMPRVVDHTVITSPATGLMVFNTTTNTFWYFNSLAWTDMGNGGTNGAWLQNGTNVYTNNNSVGVNTATPQTTLDVKGDGFVVSQKTKLTTNDPNNNVHNMPLSDYQSISQPAGILYDPSGPLAPYPSGSINTGFAIITEICTRNFPCRIIGIKLTFEAFDTEANGDSVIIIGEGNVSVKYSGNVIPPDLYFSGNALTIRFKTNGNSIVGQGFKIKWQAIEKDGTSIPITGIVGNSAYFETATGAFRSGNMGQNLPQNAGGYSVAMGYANVATGYASVAMGSSNSASGTPSIAIGTQTKASGYNSTALGTTVRATGNYSLALGNNSLSSGNNSVTIGTANNATGANSFALGNSVNATNTNSIAMGNGTTASGTNAIALGAASYATASYSTSMGFNTGAYGDYSTALGNSNVAYGYSATAMGNSTNASGYTSTAIGYGSNVTSNSAYGTAMGLYTTASSTASFASGYQTISGGFVSTSMGYNTNASGYVSTALGNGTNASGYYSTAMGTGTVGSGYASTAMGYNTTANGSNTTAMGSNVNAYYDGSFVIGDSPNSSSILYSQNLNTFNSRFRGGYYLYTSSNLASGAILYGGNNSWSTVSDSTKKENFLPIDGENVLKKIANMRTVTWNYKGQDPKSFRHYGPMAQEFFSAFGRDKLGVVGNDTTIASADFDGINFTAIKALEKRTSELQTENELLKKRLAILEKSSSEIMVLKAEMEQLKAFLLLDKERIKVKIDSDK